MKEFNKTEYDNTYRKKNKKQFNTDLNIDEYNELINLLKSNNLNKAEFIRLAKKKLEEGKLI